jgi:hypothetical protein
MPKVGKKEFAYTEKGKKAAKAYSKSSGIPMNYNGKYSGKTSYSDNEGTWFSPFGYTVGRPGKKRDIRGTPATDSQTESSMPGGFGEGWLGLAKAGMTKGGEAVQLDPRNLYDGPKGKYGEPGERMISSKTAGRIQAFEARRKRTAEGKKRGMVSSIKRKNTNS